MHTKTLMSLSALWMAMLGLIALFLPQELLAHYGFAQDRHAAMFIQVFGGAYLGFAMLNWMARHNLIGGIYSRPVAIGNLSHFMVAALTLLKAVMSGSARTSEMIAVSLVYTIFATWFALVAFGHPLRKNGTAGT
jgi:hypothetical protein